MSHSILLVIDVPDSFEAYSARWSRCNNSEFESDLSSLISTYREAGAPIIFAEQTDYSRRKAMSGTIKLAAPAALLFQPADEKKKFSGNRNAHFSRPSPICESELQWWKPPVRFATPMFAMIEMFVLVLFLVLTVIATMSCFVELSNLLDGDALWHFAAKAANGGA